MGVFDKVVGKKSKLIGSWRKLSFQYVPNRLPHRQKEQKEVARAIKPLIKGRKGKNLFIFGRSGIGKTVTVRKVLNELADYTQKVLSAYINCWDNPTSHTMIEKLVKEIGAPYTPGKGAGQLLEVVEEKLRDQKGLVVAFDEVDKGRSTEALYRLYNRFENKLSMILITNNRDFLSKLDPRLKGRLTLKELYFSPYGREEIKDILERRVKTALGKGKIEKKAFEKIVDKTKEVEDVRVGLYLLLTSGENAEASNRKKIVVEDVNEALDGFSKEDFITSSSKLNKEQELIVKTVREKEGEVTGDFYERYQENGGKLSPRSFRRYLRRLEDLGFLKLERTGEGFRGKSTKIFLGEKLK